MIHLSNKPELQTVYVPKGSLVPYSSDMTLTLRNTTDLTTGISVTVHDIGALNIYHVFAIAVGKQGDFNIDFNEDFYTWLPAVPGEYKYELASNGVIVANGLAIISDYCAEIKAYEQEITYKQYESKR